MNKLHLILFTILGTLILYKPPTDLDLGWHLQYGKQILETRQIPKTNTFSYTLPNYSWSNSYWFSQIVMYLIFSKLGYIGLSVITAGSIAFACVYFSKSLFASGVVYVGLTFFALSVRPMGFSTILMLLMLYILLKKPTAIKWLPFLFILWANVHADFVLGLFILGIYTLLHERFKPKAVLFFAACCLTTLLNPYGPDLWKTLLNETRSKQFNTILEWLPIYQYAKSTILLSFLYGLAAFFLAPIIVLRKPQNAWLIAAGVIFFCLIFKSIYFLRIVFIVGLIPTGLFLNHLNIYISKFFRPLIAGIMCVVVLIAAELFAVNIMKTVNKSLFCQTAKLPCSAVAYIREHKLAGNMFNEYNWGGYLIWNLPEYKTFIDGRMASWGELPRIYADALKTINSNDKFYKEYNVKFLLLKNSRDVEGMNVIYKDDVAVIVAL